MEVYRLEHKNLHVGPYSFHKYPKIYKNRKEFRQVLYSPGAKQTALHSGFPPSYDTPTHFCNEICGVDAFWNGLCKHWKEYKFGLNSVDNLLRWFDHPLKEQEETVWNFLCHKRDFIPVMYDVPDEFTIVENTLYTENAQVAFYAPKATRHLI